MQLKRVEITELVGVNRNAVEGVAQTSPTEIKGFNFGEAGGYYASFSQESVSVLDNLSTSVIAYDEFGLALFNDSRVLYNGAVSDQSSGSIAPLRQYIVPRVGVATDPIVADVDDYTLGGFIKDSTEKFFRDLPRLQSLTSSVVNGSTNIPNTDPTVLLFVFAPTAEGLVAYQSEKVAVNTGNTGQEITISSSTVLPTGFLTKLYLGDKTAVTAYQPSVDVYSDGSSSFTYTFTSASSDSTLDALISYCGGLACVEPHNQRVWGKASQGSITGPFFPSYNPDLYFDTVNIDEITTDNSGTWDTAFNSKSNFAIRLYGVNYSASYRINLYSGGVVPAFIDTYFARRMNGLATQFGVGIRAVIDVSANFSGGSRYTADFYWFVNVNDVITVSTSPFYSRPSSVYYAGFDLQLNNLKVFLPRTDFIVDLSGSTFTVNELDASNIVINSTSASLTGGTPATLSAAGDDLEVGAYDSSGSTNNAYALSSWFDFKSVWFYDSSAMSATVAELNAFDWDGLSTTLTSSGPNGETWTIDPSEVTRAGGSVPYTAQIDPDTTIVYSDIGFVNWGTADNYLKLPFTTSTKITALRSTPAGLVVFGENEAFLITGDPAIPSSFASQRFAGTLGCDEGVRPARLGGHIFTIWKGRLFAIALGMGDVDFGSGLTEIGQPLYDPEDPFVQVVGEPRTRHLIARTQAGDVYRYSTDVGQWCTDPWDGVANLNYLLPNIDSNGTRYVITNDAYVVSNSPSNPSVKWENLDLGDKGMKKMWRRVRVFTSDDYSGTPSLNYVINGSSGTVTATEEGSGWWVFTLPSGIVSEKAESLEVVMNGAAFGDEFEPPVIVEYVDRYSRR